MCFVVTIFSQVIQAMVGRTQYLDWQMSAQCVRKVQGSPSTMSLDNIQQSPPQLMNLDTGRKDFLDLSLMAHFSTAVLYSSVG